MGAMEGYFSEHNIFLGCNGVHKLTTSIEAVHVMFDSQFQRWTSLELSVPFSYLGGSSKHLLSAQHRFELE